MRPAAILDPCLARGRDVNIPVSEWQTKDTLVTTWGTRRRRKISLIIFREPIIADVRLQGYGNRHLKHTGNGCVGVLPILLGGLLRLQDCLVGLHFSALLHP